MNELAKKLIQENLQSKNPTLDLGNCGLDGTEAELELLAECSHLQTLIFSNEWWEYDEEKQESVEKKSQNKGQKNKLTQLPNHLPKGLEKLVLAGNWDNQWEIQDFSQLKDLKLLHTLNLNWNQIQDISFLKDLKNLHTLDLSSNKIQDISFLKDLKQLHTLDLRNNKIQDISFLKDLKNLQTLELKDNQIQDISFLKDLKNLQTLELKDNQIQDISFLKDLKQLQTLELSENQIQDISFLKDLKQLHTLELSENQIQDISFLKELKNLHTLNLSSNQIQDYSFLKELANLQNLDLSDNNDLDIKYITEILLNFHNLKSLYLNNLKIPYLPNGLLNLNNLEILELNNTGIRKLPEIKLGKLKKIALNSNPLLKELPEAFMSSSIANISISNNTFPKNLFSTIKNMESLKILRSVDNNYTFFPHFSHSSIEDLDLSSNQIGRVNLKNCEELKFINLSDNPLKIIVIESCPKIHNLNLSSLWLKEVELSDLNSLHTLDLRDNQIQDISFSKDLRNLHNLNLSSNQIQDISTLNDLKNLQTLDLRSNRIQNISTLNNLKNLQYLDLRSNQIQDISFLKDLKQLQTLDLRSNQIQDISLAFLNHLPELNDLKLYNNPVQNIPKEIFDKRGNVFNEVKNYLQAQAEGQIINLSSKIILFGNGEAGKTTLSTQLRENRFQYIEPADRTHGILVEEWTIPVKDLSQAIQEKLQTAYQEIKQANPDIEIEAPQEITLQVWDFGGQEYYHATHRLFLSNNVMYLLLWDKDTNHQDEAKGIYPLDYWRENIRNYAPNNIIIEVQNKDKGAAQINHQERKYKLHFRSDQQRDIQRYEFDIEDLKEGIFKNLHHLEYLGKPFPKVYEDIRRALAKEEKPFLSFEEYQTLCQEQDFTTDTLMQNPSQIQTLTNFLHDTGAIICYRFHEKFKNIQSLQDYIFTQPTWVTDWIYKILDKKFKGVGEFDKAHIETTTKDSGINTEVWIELMKIFELIFEIKKKGKTLFVAPQYLPKTCPNQEALEYALDCNLQDAFTIHYPKFLPRSLFLRFIAKYGSQSERYLYWKSALFFKLNQKGVFATCDYTARKITIQIQDKDPQTSQAIFQTLFELSNQREDIELFSEKKNKFLAIQEIKEYKEVYQKEFSFLFGEGHLHTFKPKTKIDMNETIQKALLALQNANMAGYFDEMDKVAIPEEQEYAYSQHKKRFISGQAPFDFHEQLSVFAKTVAKALSSPTDKKVKENTDIVQAKEEVNNSTKQKILFLSANPSNEARLQTDKEYRTIQQAIRASEQRDTFETLNPSLGVTVQDLLTAMNQKPEIVHFAGHGNSKGIIITNSQNEAQVMPTKAINRLFRQHQESTKLVILNACYSAEQAKIISEFGIYVIGMNTEIEDSATISFAGGLYIGLGAGKEVETAFDDAMIVIETEYPEAELIPEIWHNGEKLDL